MNCSSADHRQAYLETDLMERGKRVGGQTGVYQEGHRNLMTSTQQTASSDICVDRGISCVCETLPFYSRKYTSYLCRFLNDSNIVIFEVFGVLLWDMTSCSSVNNYYLLL